MTSQQIFEQIQVKQSFLCVGLDTDLKKVPQHLLGSEDPIFEFNKAVIDATAPYCVSYKPNLAFYEAAGVKGWNALVKTVRYLREHYPEQFLIADAKRGDIGNTSQMYARVFFQEMDFDAVTLSPYMGSDTAEPFYAYPGKWAVLLALTSNTSAQDFETLPLADGGMLYEQVIKTSMDWGTEDNTMYVVGATRAEQLGTVRAIVPDHFLLVPGVGAQGGSLEEVAKYGMNRKCGLLVNSSRGIIYASSGRDFAEAAGRAAQELQRRMAVLLEQYGKE
ncbi:orotidine-5'-phosphate decarboxylase [uncultured Rikenella sp.]|uniref:orotidine-5'-phosphate decarboxylase n=1 Tax=uncultured Rikenella sp. TaxID=368003 RepID=UPI00261903C2|nr:orotidine-5'-phosphate decarboxylase [uncultured Rikenella sp.]